MKRPCICGTFPNTDTSAASADSGSTSNALDRLKIRQCENRDRDERNHIMSEKFRKIPALKPRRAGFVFINYWG